ncbi:MAG: hypothetical protein KGJ77_05495, partial [Acidobacteriota bacterium]|nr:hypothetical protein [Acidobacteriota bacterium]
MQSAMAEVEAAVAARQHNLQFVDLDQISVDTTVAAVLPAALARRHHVVPIGRRFGAPVVAMADPTDVMAVDTLRATLGREFIAVVADPGQIERCLEEVYAGSPAVAVDPSPDRARQEETPEAPADESDGLENLLVGYGGGTKSGSGTSLADLLPNIPAPGTGPRMPKHARLASPPPPPEPEVASGPPAGRDAGDVVVALASAAEAASAGVLDGAGHDPDDERVLVQLDDYGLDRYGLDAFGAGRAVAEASPDSPAPEWESAPEPPGLQEPSLEMGETSEPGLQWRDPQEPELLEPELEMPETDGSDPAAAEAVAHRGDELDQAADAASSEPVGSDPAIAHWPPLARVLVEGGRVSVEDMEGVLEDRDRTGNAITRILTARGLVSEADLMWAMAEEMGLEFVDLDVRTVDFGSAYALPESTARHHSVLLVGYEEGTPVVAASNPTDVFAMDDLRTILGRNFVTVVATRSQITTYIDKAYNQGGDASEVANTASSDFDEIDEDL